MKNSHQINLLAAAFLFVYGCNQQPNPQKKIENVVKEECLIATYEGDTAKIRISYLDSLNVKGKLKINYANHNKNNGSFDGKFKGDTLFVDFRFFTANEAMGSFTNPLVFLKRGDSLTMGVGQIETTLGRSYFVKGKPLNFERAKFVFEKADCN